jgi:hypothetical protein
MTHVIRKNLFRANPAATMKRLLFLLATMSSALAAEDSVRRILDAQHYHLGVAGLAEWEEFAASTPHGRQLDVTFTAEANDAEQTLFIRQREVRTTWNVMLNGRKLSTLETLTQPLVRTVIVPAGALHTGENRLSIMRPPTAVIDDIEVGEIALDPRPRAAALGEASLEIVVTDADSRSGLPCRLTLVDAQNALMPFAAAAGQKLAVRTGVVYTGDGAARVSVSAGDYVLYASRGFEYGVASQRLQLASGDRKAVALQLRREVPTPGLISADTHIHTLTYSKHGDATIDERMLTIAGEGIELAVATDHNHHADYTEPAARMKVNTQFTPVVGNEVTTEVGHFNAFPVPAGGPVPDAKLTDWVELLHNVRTVTGAKVITLNHPRDMHAKFTPFAPENFDATTGELKKAARFDCDAVEVVTSAAMQSDILQLYRDWFALLNHGYRIAAIAASDTHHVSEFILGQARTYVVSNASDPAHIDIDEVCASYRSGRLLVSLGLLTQMKVDDRFDVGDLATKLGDELRVTVDVFGPSWVNADRVELYANGIKLREEPIAPTTESRKAHVTFKLPRPKHDVHLVAIATGPGVTAPYWEIPRPYQPTSKVVNLRVIGSTNPIWIDGDGDGQFTSARAYAAKLVAAAAGDEANLKAALAGYDAAVAVQAADLAKQ